MNKCSLCKKVLEEGGMDHHNLDHPYELPYKMVWLDETHCQMTNKVVWSICGKCLRKIMKAVNECVNEEK